MRKHNMDIVPILELPPHQERRRRRRSSFYDEKMEEKELMLLKAGVRPEWLQVHRIINLKLANCYLIHEHGSHCKFVICFRSHRSGTKFLVKWRELPYDKATWENSDSQGILRGFDDAVRQYEKLK